MSKSYLGGKPVDVEHTHHVLPLKLYFQIFGILLVLTALTVAVSIADLGAASLWVALFVAVVKASLVVGYFMHLKYDDRFLAFVAFFAVLFVAIFFLLTFADISTRADRQAEWDNLTKQEQTIQADPKLDEARRSFLERQTHH